MRSNLVELGQPEKLSSTAFQFTWPAVQPRQTGIKVGKIRPGTGSQIVRIVEAITLLARFLRTPLNYPVDGPAN